MGKYDFRFLRKNEIFGFGEKKCVFAVLTGKFVFGGKVYFVILMENCIFGRKMYFLRENAF